MYQETLQWTLDFCSETVVCCFFFSGLGVNPAPLQSSPTTSFFAFLLSFKGGWITTWVHLESFPTSGLTSRWVGASLWCKTNSRPPIHSESWDFLVRRCSLTIPLIEQIPMWQYVQPCAHNPLQSAGWPDTELPQHGLGTCSHHGCCHCRFPSSKVWETFSHSPSRSNPILVFVDQLFCAFTCFSAAPFRGLADIIWGFSGEKIKKKSGC